jgi:hypothetical protein
MKNIFLIILLVISPLSNANLYNTTNVGEEWNSDLTVGGDIFSDFNEDLEATKVMEDERFYRYGRFFTLNVGLGHTSFTGNRGVAYKDTYSATMHLSLMYFLNFQSTFNIGIEYSSHTMFIDTYVSGSPNELIGAVDTNLLRPFVGFRYYMDTTDLGTAITYSNPYFTGRAEYWYQTNIYRENTNLSNESGGAIGTAVGLGLEFPMELKETYFNVEFLYHFVTFFDEFTTQYQQIPIGARCPPNQSSCEQDTEQPSEYGYQDLYGDVMTITATYNFNW